MNKAECIMIGLIIGILIGMWMGSKVEQTNSIKWVETCYPNKPSWGDPIGTCWVNGNRVILEKNNEL